MTDAFDEAKDQCDQLGIAAVGSYQGMMKVLVRYSASLLLVLWPRLQQLMQEIGGDHWQIDGWVPIAFDGSRSSAPRTKSNEQALCAPHYGKGATAKYRKKKTKGLRRKKNEKNKPQPQQPQAWITLMWHMGLRLPWMWRLGPSNSSERAHVEDMLLNGDFPKNTLFCRDAGFVGYPLWSQIIGRGNHFLVRVGANVNLLHKSANVRLSGDRVFCWPQDAQRKNLPPLELRLLKVKVGKTKMWMLTSVLDSARLPKALIARFYQLRWGIELFFRTYKTGCGVEEVQLESEARLMRCLMFYKIVTWRILYLTFLGRECPELPCDVVFADEEWKSVWRIVKKEELPSSAPSLAEFIPILAQLGGYNGRKSDPPPGPEVLWRAVRRMMDFALAWQAFGPTEHI